MNSKFLSEILSRSAACFNRCHLFFYHWKWKVYALFVPPKARDKDYTIKGLPFPAYLAFGKLDAATVRFEGDQHVADYYLLGMKVMQIRMGPDGVQLNDVFGVERNGFTRHRTIERAVLHHFTCWRPSTHPTFRFFQEKVASLGNIYFSQIDEKGLRTVFYPAGHLFIFRLPVSKTTVLKIADLIAYHGYLFNYCHDMYETSFSGIDHHFKLAEKKMCIVEFAVPMADVYECAQYLVRHRLVLQQQHNQLVIQDIGKKMKDYWAGFKGRKGGLWQSYAIKYRQLTDSGFGQQTGAETGGVNSGK